MITYNGKEFKTRTFLVDMPEMAEPTEITIADESLQEELGDMETQEASDIDDQIYFYVEVGKLDLPAKDICSFHLDEPMTLLKEVFDWDDDTTPTFYVDIPQLMNGVPTDEWRNVESFKDRDEAIAYAKKYFGADDNGMICLISQS